MIREWERLSLVRGLWRPRADVTATYGIISEECALRAQKRGDRNTGMAGLIIQGFSRAKDTSRDAKKS